jgi:cytoskeletal protein RodZ
LLTGRLLGKLSKSPQAALLRWFFSVRFTRIFWVVFLTTALAAAQSFASNVHRGPTAPSATRSKTTPSSTKSATKSTSTRSSSKSTSSKTVARAAAASRSRKIKGQQAIDSDRVTQIQQALIREHYLNGDANGNWDAPTVAAMQKFQADNGWQTKLAPDGRALKKLGLGPDYSGAINAKDSSFVDPPPVTSIPTEQAAGFTAASGLHQ